MNNSPGASNANASTGPKDPATFNDVSDNVITSEPGDLLADDDKINLDDALDDDNENPVSQTLIDAAENTGPEEIRTDVELEGEVDEDGQE